MKLQRIRTELPPARLRVTLPGELKVTLDAYAAYYHEQYGDTVGIDALIPQILTTFVDNDRAFHLWQQTHVQDTSPPLPHRPALTTRTKRRREGQATVPTSTTIPNGVTAHETTD